jgi:NTP pyrophosphatase (non-canonical NTP hydrolase)
MDLKELQDRIHAKRVERGFHMEPLSILAMLTEEVGEVASELKPTWSKNYDNFDKAKLAEELSDVLVCISALASTHDIDLEASVKEKFFHSDELRDWATKKNSN